MFGNIIFRQLFDGASSTYTYVMGDPQSLQGVIIDTVFEQHFRDRALVEELGLKLLAVLDTHCHADHVTGLRSGSGIWKCALRPATPTDASPT
jgi:sulfur dioxygenase